MIIYVYEQSNLTDPISIFKDVELGTRLLRVSLKPVAQVDIYWGDSTVTVAVPAQQFAINDVMFGDDRRTHIVLERRSQSKLVGSLLAGR